MGELTTLAVFFIIYLMMVNLRIEALLQAGKNIKGLLLVMAFSFVWAPLLGLVLARISLNDRLLALGFLLVTAVPAGA